MSLIPRHSLFDLDHLFDRTWPALQNNPNSGAFAPRVDIKENDQGYEISAELPGVDKKDVQVTLHNGVLSIEAETRTENKEEKDGKLIRQERRYGRFMRSFDLGQQVQESDIRAAYQDGILTLQVPKSPAKVPTARRIEIS